MSSLFCEKVFLLFSCSGCVLHFKKKMTTRTCLQKCLKSVKCLTHVQHEYSTSNEVSMLLRRGLLVLYSPFKYAFQLICSVCI